MWRDLDPSLRAVLSVLLLAAFVGIVGAIP